MNLFKGDLDVDVDVLDSPFTPSSLSTVSRSQSNQSTSSLGSTPQNKNLRSPHMRRQYFLHDRVGLKDLKMGYYIFLLALILPNCLMLL